jgi:hypothetical protein
MTARLLFPSFMPIPNFFNCSDSNPGRIKVPGLACEPSFSGSALYCQRSLLLSICEFSFVLFNCYPQISHSSFSHGLGPVIDLSEKENLQGGAIVIEAKTTLPIVSGLSMRLSGTEITGAVHHQMCFPKSGVFDLC